MISVRHFGLIYVVVLKQHSNKFAFPLLVAFILAKIFHGSWGNLWNSGARMCFLSSLPLRYSGL